ncbi:MAG TPA: succinylglutamate desuccinylase/aspartoacylase family protein, partial [Flavobacteriaceae bacterium]|nr:succinylglutamate desuccinylase/aspartoacylase family protein [Flavobacteriaceae bacterium]
TILPGERKNINFIASTLYTNTELNIPVIVARAKKRGSTVLITAGIHGDEINGVEIIRKFISRKMNQPKKGTIICIPIINIHGFLNMERYFPDGRDLNRSFPGFKRGSLASRFAYQFTHEILPIADVCLDFHSGGAKRFNAAQIRLTKGCEKSLKLAKTFNAPFTLYSKALPKSLRSICVKKEIPYLIFEGGMSGNINKEVAQEGVIGILRVLKNLGMLKQKFAIKNPVTKTIFIKKTRWIRASYSGMFHKKIAVGQYAEKGTHLASITDPYGSFLRKIKSPHDGFIINANLSPIVFEGDALFNITKNLDHAKNETQEDLQGKTYEFKL